MDRKVILISGKQGSGKSTLAANLVAHFREKKLNPLVIKFADSLYEMHNAVLRVLANQGVPVQPDKTLLQVLGEWARTRVHEDLFVQLMNMNIQFSGTADVIIIDDLRFVNEFEGVEGFKVRLEASEDVRKVRCSQWRDNSSHKSEIDLDNSLDKFNLVVHTDTLDSDSTLQTVLDALPPEYKNVSGPKARKAEDPVQTSTP